jgi:surface carbohydrate biosynthesis protein
MTLKKTILISIEIKDREFLSRSLLAYELIKKGFRVYLGSNLGIYYIAKKINPSIIFHKSSWRSRSAYFKSLGHVFTFMDEEGGIAIPRSYLKKFCKERYHSLSKKNVDVIFLPSFQYLDAVKKVLGAKAKNIKLCVTGWPRMDMWNEKYDFLYKSEIKQIKKEYKKFYLFPTSFGMNDLKSFTKLMDVENPSYRKNVRFKYSALLNYIYLLKKLSGLLKKGEQIIIRPHQREDLLIWKKIFKDFINIKVIRKGSLQPWILAAAGTIQHGSTAVVQASLRGIVSLQYKVIKKRGITDSPCFELCKNLSSTKKFYNLLKTNLYRNSNTIRNTKNILAKYIFYNESRSATSRIVEELESIKINPIEKVKISLFYLYLYNFNYFYVLIKDFFNKLNFNFLNFYSTANRLSEDLNQNKIENFFKLISKENKFLKKININNVAKDVFCIEAKKHEINK